MSKRYINTKTGAIIDSSSTIVGENWKEYAGKEKNKKVETEQEYIEEEIVLEDMTNKELEEFAKSNGIELTTADKKNKETRIEAIAKAFEESEE